MDDVTGPTPTPEIERFVEDIARVLMAAGATPDPAADRHPGHARWRHDSIEDVVVRTIVDSAADRGLVCLSMSLAAGYRFAAFLPDAVDAASRPWILVDVLRPGESLPDPKPVSKPDALPTGWKLVRGIRYEEPAFFTVLGPEGVGKTTLCNNLIRIFRNYPIAFRQFHHTSEWKGGNPEDAAMTASAKIQAETFGEAHQEEAHQGSSSGLRSAVRRVLPRWLYRNISAFRAELIYMQRVATYLANCHFNSELVIADRYCYDRLVRWRNLGKPRGQRIGAYLVSRLMRRPFHAFVLRDTPARIAARKQAMPEWEIARHQEMLAAVCRRYTVPFEEIWVSDLDADAVAQLVAQRILESTGNTVFDLIDRHLAEASQR